MRKHTVYLLVAAGVVAGILVMATAEQNAAPKGEFARTTIDIGVVVSDVEKATAFYTKALGCTPAGSFDVSAQMATDTGLTDSKPFQVRVFTLGGGPTATQLKVMQIPGARKVDNQYISSSLGIRYLTVFVANLTSTLERLKQNGVAPVKEPYRLGGGDTWLALVKDPDGNIVELLGPR
jgi:catechol 2,3-dioxygenase-like lactoylglutathione lyase family enzyme